MDATSGVRPGEPWKICPGETRSSRTKSHVLLGMLAMVFNSPNNMWSGSRNRWPANSRSSRARCPMAAASRRAHALRERVRDLWQEQAPRRGLATGQDAHLVEAASGCDPEEHRPGLHRQGWNDPEVWAANPSRGVAKSWAKITKDTAGVIPVPSNTRRAEFHDYYGNEWPKMLYGDVAYDKAGMDKLDAALRPSWTSRYRKPRVGYTRRVRYTRA